MSCQLCLPSVHCFIIFACLFIWCWGRGQGRGWGAEEAGRVGGGGLDVDMILSVPELFYLFELSA